MGIGLPTMVVDFLPDDIEIVLQSENGIMRMGPAPDKTNPNIVNTVHDYVTFWTTGDDSDFAKDGIYIYDMSNGPYYAISAGVDFGGADAGVYNVEMSGHGFGFAVNSGRIAGETAAKELIKENSISFLNK